MSIGKVSVSRPVFTSRTDSLETARAELKTARVSDRSGESRFDEAPVGQPKVDLQGGALRQQGGVNGASDVDAARVELLKGKLEAYGITLSGDWNNPDELAVLLRTVRTMDVKLKRLMKAEGETGFATGELFQRVFGQVTFERVDQPELAPGKYAEQTAYNTETGTSTVRMSDKAFTVTTGNGRALTPEQLLGHELAHIINRRFQPSDGGTFGGSTLNSPPNGSLGFAARTNVTPAGPEWVADVFANSLLGTLKMDNPEQVAFAQRVRDTLLYLMSDDAKRL